MAREKKTVGEILGDKLIQLQKMHQATSSEGRKADLMDQMNSITADPRYLPYVEQYVRQNPTPESEKLLQEVKKTHKLAVELQEKNPPSIGLKTATNKVYELAEHHGRKERGELLTDEIKNLSSRSKDGFGANLSKDTLMHVQADPRYIKYFDEYLESSSLSEEKKDHFRAKAQKAHVAAIEKINCCAENPAAIRGVEQIFSKIESNGAGPLNKPDTDIKLASAKKTPAAVKIESANDTPAHSGEDKSTTSPHAIKHGDSLWSIAKDHYGLTDPKDIQKAVEKIAHENGMDGVKANHLKIGQEIKLPNSPSPAAGTPSLDWKSLDADNGATLRKTFHAETPAFKPDTAPKADTVPATAMNDDTPSVTSRETYGWGRSSNNNTAYSI